MLDTGPLLEFLLVQTNERLGRSWARQPELHSISTVPLADDFGKVLRSSPNRVFTTPAVLAELHGRTLSADDDYRATFWSILVQALEQERIRERGDLPLVGWPRELRERLGRFGPTDVGLLAVGQVVAREYDEAVVVTNESPLLGEVARLGWRRLSASDPTSLIRQTLGDDAVAD